MAGQRLRIVSMGALVADSSLAQDINASLSGTVTDASGAVVPKPPANFNGANTSLSVHADPATGQAVFNSPSFSLITSAEAARSLQLVARLNS